MAVGLREWGFVVMGLKCKIIAVGRGFKIIQCKVCHPECDDLFPYCLYDLNDQALREERGWHLEQDLQTEDELAWAHVYEQSDVPWPWYADEPCIIQESEVFGP